MRVEWVHPSWRDLVIEALADDAEARRHFLQRCGVDGAAVALSWGGGATGERQRPLLRCDADWDALGDGLYSLCYDCDEVEAIQLLGLLDAAGEFDEVLALARIVLERLGWAGKAISVDAIGAWMPLAVKLDPRPELPAIALTWLELEPSEAPRTPGELERFADWVQLADILLVYDRELLDGLDFPHRRLDVLTAFLDQHPLDEPPIERDLRAETVRRLVTLGVKTDKAVYVAAGPLPDLDFVVEEEPRIESDGFPVERVLRDL